MATYAIGDVQGCQTELYTLLKLVDFRADKDTLWFTGDLVNRGPESLAVLRFVKDLPDHHVTVLGNHDLHLLAVAHGAVNASPGDTLDEILSAPDAQILLEWLAKRPLIYHDEKSQFTLTHAGIAPQWNLSDAIGYAGEVQDILQSDRLIDLLASMYGNEPNLWKNDLQGWDRSRCIINYFTRMRFCDINGRMNLEEKGAFANGLYPWFKVPGRKNKDLKIVFGHWASLEKNHQEDNIYPIDTGCVWGNKLTAFRVEDGRIFSVPSQQKVAIDL